jgi:GWxTD domain-containing protein
VKKAWIFLSLLAMAAVSFAQLSKYKDWPKSPDAYFLTQEEKTAWVALHTDEDAEKFIADYWAKRGGQKFKDEIARRIRAADEQFRSTRQKGSQSARGRVLIVLGAPSRVTTERAQITGEAGPGQPLGAQEPFVQTWLYDKTKFDASWGIGEIRARVLVDPSRGSDELQGAAPVDKAIATVAEKSIIHAAGTAAVAAAPSAGTAGSAPAPAAAAVPPMPPVSLPASIRSDLEAILKNPKSAQGAAWSGPFHSVSGKPFFSVELSVPSDRVPAGGVKFGGIVTSDAGEQAAVWEEATLADSKTGAKTEKVYERSVVLPPGNYRAAYGLFNADGSQVLATGSASFRLGAAEGEFEVSPLLLTNIVSPLTKRPGETDPFVFGMERPVHVSPKASHLFGKDESLWYFFTVTNPKLAAGAPAAPSATPAPSSATPAPSGSVPTPAAPESASKPRVMTRIGVLRGGQPAFAPYTSPAELQPLGPNYYAAGSEIPLATFEPGYYTFTLSVRDMNAPRDSAAFKGVDMQADFVVLKPDGALPDKPAPPTPAKSKAPAKKN